MPSDLRAQENARLERGLLPSPLLLEGSEVSVVTRYRPSRTNALLGGDFYDVVQTPDRTVHIVIGDVAGHGPDEAALGVALRIAWRTLTLAGVHGDAAMRQLERILHAEGPGRGIFATMLSLAVAPDSPQVITVRAGHPGMLVHGRGTVDWVEPPAGPALGWGGDGWPQYAMELPEGGGLVLLTDGLFEAHSGRRCRTPRRERFTGTGPAAGVAARPGVRRRAHRPRRGSGPSSWRVQRRRRGGAGRAQRR